MSITPAATQLDIDSPQAYTRSVHNSTEGGGNKVTTPKNAQGRAGLVRDETFEKNGIITIGMDPGARHSAICIRDGDVPIFAGTITRELSVDPVRYALQVVDKFLEVVAEILIQYPNVAIGIEGVVAPKGFKGGKRAPLNPEHIVRTGVTAGALAGAFRAAHIVRPRNNGSQHISQYPDTLQGRRNFDLLPGFGAGVRNHEQSAYDIALKALNPSTL